MALINRAALLLEINALITSQTFPDAITPTILGGVLADIVDSDVNQLDLLLNGVSLQTYITNLFNQLSGGLLGMNGQPGQFSVSLAEEQLIYLVASGVGQQILLLNETENGAFDNGSFFDGGAYRVPPAGFIGKFQITDGLAEITRAPASGTDTYHISINQYDSAGTVTATLATVSFAVASGATLLTPIYIPILRTANVTLSVGSRVRVDIDKVPSGSTDGIVNLKTLMFTNTAL